MPRVKDGDIVGLFEAWLMGVSMTKNVTFFLLDDPFWINIVMQVMWIFGGGMA